MMDVAFAPLQDSQSLPAVLNLVHPRPVPWNFVINSIRNALAREGKDLEVVDFIDWYKALQACAAGSYAVENFVGANFTSNFPHQDAEFGGINFAVDKIQVLSPSVRNSNSITEQNVEAWMEYWHASGFL